MLIRVCIVITSLALFLSLSLKATLRADDLKLPSKDERLKQIKKLRENSKAAPMQEIAAVLKFLEDADPEVRAAAIYAAASALLDQDKERKQVCPVELIRTLLDSNADVRGSAATMVPAFWRYPDDALPLILNAFESDDAWVSANMVNSMFSQWTKDPRVLKALKKAAQDKRWVVRGNTCVYLGESLNDFSIPLACWLEGMVVLAEDFRRTERGEKSKLEKSERTCLSLMVLSAWERLDEMSKKEPAVLTKALLKQLSSPSPVVRVSAVKRIASLHSKHPSLREPYQELRVIAELNRLRKDRNQSVRDEIPIAIGQIEMK